jgi:hypothetical protein
MTSSILVDAEDFAAVDQTLLIYIAGTRICYSTMSKKVGKIEKVVVNMQHETIQ